MASAPTFSSPDSTGGSPAGSPAESPGKRALRDYIWSITSPSLIGPIDSRFPGEHWFASLSTQSPDELPLPAPKHPHRFRLGQHFETLWHHWFQQNDDWLLRETNLQVQDGKRTVGEFDLLAENENGVEHWELAIKFFLGIGDCSKLHNWFGPNTNDRFDLKFERMLDHQLVMSEQKAAIALLEQRDLRIDRVRCVVKGRLFYPWAQYNGGILTGPDIVANDHCKGWWMTLDEFKQQFRESPTQFCYLTKINWLSTVEPGDDLPVWGHTEMIGYLSSEEAQQATLVALLDPQGYEISRGFVVSPMWLQRVAPLQVIGDAELPGV